MVSLFYKYKPDVVGRRVDGVDPDAKVFKCQRVALLGQLPHVRDDFTGQRRGVRMDVLGKELGGHTIPIEHLGGNSIGFFCQKNNPNIGLKTGPKSH